MDAILNNIIQWALIALFVIPGLLFLMLAKSKEQGDRSGFEAHINNKKKGGGLLIFTPPTLVLPLVLL